MHKSKWNYCKNQRIGEFAVSPRNIRSCIPKVSAVCMPKYELNKDDIIHMLTWKGERAHSLTPTLRTTDN